MRINKDFSNLLFEETEGKTLGSFIKIIEVAKNDPRYARIPFVSQQVMENHKQSFFFGWTIKRKYNPRELDGGQLLYLLIRTKFEPCGRGMWNYL